MFWTPNGVVAILGTSQKLQALCDELNQRSHEFQDHVVRTETLSLIKIPMDPEHHIKSLMSLSHTWLPAVATQFDCDDCADAVHQADVRLLVIVHAYPERTCLSLPGGKRNLCESSLACAMREAKEEAGLESRLSPITGRLTH